MLRSEFAAKLEMTTGYPIMRGVTYVYRNHQTKDQIIVIISDIRQLCLTH